MKKILLATILATCAMTSAYAGNDSFRLHCHSTNSNGDPMDGLSIKMVGTNKIAYVRLSATDHDEYAYEYTFNGHTLNEVGESRYYSAKNETVRLNKDSSEVVISNDDTYKNIVFECGV